MLTCNKTQPSPEVSSATDVGKDGNITSFKTSLSLSSILIESDNEAAATVIFKFVSLSVCNDVAYLANASKAKIVSCVETKPPFSLRWDDNQRIALYVNSL